MWKNAHLQQLALREAGLSVVQDVRHEVDGVVNVRVQYEPAPGEVVTIDYEVPVELLLDITFQLADFEVKGGGDNVVRGNSR